VKARTHRQDNALIVYDANHIRHPGLHLFDPGYWEQRGALEGKAAGRGCVLFVKTDFAPAVLKQYLRGGWAAKVSRERYVFTGFERSRPMMEFNILERLSVAGLPAPQALAALCQRAGRLYSGWLLTRRIMHTEPLADVVSSRRGDPMLWRNTGACIRRFHAYGLVHADLNARNILVGEDGFIHLVDFDRSRIHKGATGAFAANLRRLRRSFEKIWPDDFHGQLEPCWNLLQEGYDKGPATT
jgi:3-deoxy-D-manno-octulosonic acid kinase